MDTRQSSPKSKSELFAHAQGLSSYDEMLLVLAARNWQYLEFLRAWLAVTERYSGSSCQSPKGKYKNRAAGALSCNDDKRCNSGHDEDVCTPLAKEQGGGSVRAGALSHPCRFLSHAKSDFAMTNAFLHIRRFEIRGLALRCSRRKERQPGSRLRG